MTIVPQGAETLSDRVGEVVFRPWMLSAVLPSRIAVIFELKLFYVERSWKIFGYFVRYGPDRYSICAKFLAEKILMELDQGINAIFRRILDSFPHELEISLIELSFFRLDSWPHNSESNTVDTHFLEFFHICFVELGMIGWSLADEIEAVEDELASCIIYKPTIFDVDGRRDQVEDEYYCKKDLDNSHHLFYCR